MTMTENTDHSESDCTDSSIFDIGGIPSSDIIDDADRIVTVRRPPCDACETQHHNGLEEVPLGETTHDVCSDCVDHLIAEIERYYWWERLSEAQYDRAAEYLRSLDEIWCVHDNGYPGGEMWVHTPFCDAGVVEDVCDHFGFRIHWFTIVRPDDCVYDCVDDHGPCIEINLDYNNRVKEPLPLEYDIFEDRGYSDIEYLSEQDKLFNQDN